MWCVFICHTSSLQDQPAMFCQEREKKERQRQGKRQHGARKPLGRTVCKTSLNSSQSLQSSVLLCQVIQMSSACPPSQPYSQFNKDSDWDCHEEVGTHRERDRFRPQKCLQTAHQLRCAAYACCRVTTSTGFWPFWRSYLGRFGLEVQVLMPAKSSLFCNENDFFRTNCPKSHLAKNRFRAFLHGPAMWYNIAGPRRSAHLAHVGTRSCWSFWSPFLEGIFSPEPHVFLVFFGANPRFAKAKGEAWKFYFQRTPALHTICLPTKLNFGGTAPKPLYLQCFAESTSTKGGDICKFASESAGEKSLLKMACVCLEPLTL